MSKSKNSFRNRSMEEWSSRVSGARASVGNDFTNGHRGHAKAVAGAKKYIRSRDRLARKAVVREAMDGRDQ